MKKLFTVLVASLCGTMAYAQSGAISVSDVSISKGGTAQMEVSINNAANQTAFQFDLAVPTGYSVKGADFKGTYGESRHLLNGEVGGKVRFLSYDDGNAKLADGEKVIVTLEAEAEAETAIVTGDGIVVVAPDGSSVGNEETASANINISGDVDIEIPWGGKTTFVCSQDLDFSSLADVKAYIVTGYDVTEGSIWLTRVNDVPANTPIWVAGPKGEKNAASTTVKIPTGTSTTYYPQNLLVGSATASADIPAETDEFLNYTIGKDGSIAPRPSGISGFPAGKAYLHFAKKVSSVVGSAASVNLVAKGNKLAYVSPCDLDFTSVDGLKAYLVTGYAKDGTMWLTRVMKVSANTPLYLKGEKAEFDDIPSVATQMQLVNMLKGDATNTSSIIGDDGVFTTCVLSKNDGVFNPIGRDVAAFPAGTAFLPLPNSHFKVAASRGNIDEPVFNFKEAEVIKVSLGLGGDATGISRVAAEAGDDTWYNLSGQRINTPNKKGLYIKNGKKVIVK